jgi:hypothetical protein
MLPGSSGGFLRTLHNHPELASRVREISVGGIWHMMPRVDLSMSKAKMTTHIRTLSLPYESALVDVVPRHPEEVELALSVFNARTSVQVLKRLQSCRCNNKSHRMLWLTPLLYAAQKYAYAPDDTSNGFGKLQYLAIDRTGISLAEIAPVLLLPSLKTLHLYGTSPDINHRSWDIRSRSSRVQNINIMWSNLLSDDASLLLQSCETVVDFRYQQSDVFGSNTDEWLSTLLEAVILHSRTLKCLVLMAYESRIDSRLERWPQNDSLSEMEELEKLELHYTVVMGKHREQNTSHTDETVSDRPETARSLHDLLPPNLVDLKLRYDKSFMHSHVDYTAELRDLLRDNSSRHRKLRKVVIHYSHDIHSAKFPLMLNTLKRYFKARGIVFRYTVYYSLRDEGKYFLFP